MGTGPEVWSAAHTLDSGSLACAQSFHLDVYMAPPSSVFCMFFFFFWEETGFILNIIYLCI